MFQSSQFDGKTGFKPYSQTLKKLSVNFHEYPSCYFVLGLRGECCLLESNSLDLGSV